MSRTFPFYSLKLSSVLLVTLLCLLMINSTHSTQRGGGHESSDDDDVVRSSCVHASYPSICVRTLSSYPDPPKTPREVAEAAVKVSIAHARKMSQYLAEQKAATIRKREKAALKDCLEQMGDSVDELERTLSELGRLSSRVSAGYNKLRMSNAETWVSAALSNDETCLDGLGESGRLYKEEVWNKVVGVAKVTSNALYFINQLDHKP